MLWSICLFHTLVTIKLFHVSTTKKRSESMFASANEVTAKVMRALAEILNNGFLESFQKLYNVGKSVSLPKVETCKQMRLLISV
jgi:hypothetical protein